MTQRLPRRISLQMMFRILLLICLVPLWSAHANNTDAPQTQSGRLIAAINAVRLVENRPVLRIDPRLTAAAKAHVAKMAVTPSVGSKDPKRSDLAERLVRARYKFALALQNIAAGQGEAPIVVAEWLESNHHRQNLLDPSVRDIGAAHLYSTPGKAGEPPQHYWVVVMGLAASAVETEQANAKR